MIESLQEWIQRDGGDANAHIVYKGDTEGATFLLQAVDTTGVIASQNDGTGPLIAIPWSSISFFAYNPKP